MRQINQTIGLLLCAGLSASCSDRQGVADEREVSVNYDEIDGSASGIVSKHRSACELADGAEQAGAYRVASMTGVYEEVADGTWEPWTYVELELVDEWSKDASDVTLRIQGGPFPDGSRSGHFLTLARGETIGGVVLEPPVWNTGYRFIETDQLFRETDGTMSNGRVSAPTGELATILARAIDDDECPVDIAPEEPERPPYPDMGSDGDEMDDVGVGPRDAG